MLCAACVLSAGVVGAQESSSIEQQPEESTVVGVADARQGANELLNPNLYSGMEEANQRTLKMRDPGVSVSDIKSLFFMTWQRPLLEEAKREMWRNRGVASYEASRPAGQQPPRIKGPRELALGGIVFSNGDDWVVWLNGQRLTPKAIPKEVMDIQVNKDVVELRWYDSWTNLIYPVRLRPHQRFNLDSRIFLPGTSQL